MASPETGLAGPLGEKPAQINACGGLALKIHLKALCKIPGCWGVCVCVCVCVAKGGGGEGGGHMTS